MGTRLPLNIRPLRKFKSEVVTMNGINWGDATRAGDLSDSFNISARRYPFLATRNKRKKLENYKNVTALTSWDKLVAVQGTELLFDGTKVGDVTAGAKQFAVINTKMVIWPDKVYLDLEDKKVKPLGASISIKGASFSTNTITKSNVDFTALFKAGDGITVTGCKSKTQNNKDAVIKKVEKTRLTFGDNTFVSGTESGEIKIERKIPNLDYICECQNRLWGVSSKEQTIFASALGDPTNFYVYQGLTTDSYALAVGTSRNFTGICKLSNDVLCWKESTLHKVMGSYPAEYSMYTYEIEGLQEGSYKSMQVINENLFYKGLHGVYAYSGGTPSLISINFGNRLFTDAIAGNDGDSYYISMEEGDKTHMLVYETREGVWLREDATLVKDFARIGKDLYMVDEVGDVYLMDDNAPITDELWQATFTPFYETIEGRKMVSKVIIRLELPKGSYVVADIREDGGKWEEFTKIIGSTEDAVALRMPIGRCDKYELRLRGKGQCTVLEILREYLVRSDR